MIHFLRCTVWLTALLLMGTSHAANYDQISEGERYFVDEALRERHLQIDPHPQGKRVKRFYIDTLNPYPFEKGVFKILRKLHVKTKDRFLIGQLLMRPGDLFSENVLIETEIRLTDSKVRSSALIFPVQPLAKESDHTVDLLVLTRDVVSLRSILDFTLVGGALSQFTIGATEASIAGTNKLGSFSFQLKPYLIDLSALYIDPDFLSSRHQLTASQSVLLNSASGHYEGLGGQLKFERVLYSEEDNWGYGVHLDYVYEPRFQLDGLKLRIFNGAEWKYRYMGVNGDASLTRSFGRAVKNNFTVGYGFAIRRPILFEDFPLSGQAAAEYIHEVMPIREFQSYVNLRYQYFWNRFLSMYDYDTFGLQEWQRLGPIVTASGQIALGILGSQYNFFRPSLAVSYAHSFGRSSLFQLSLKGETRMDGKFENNMLSGQLLLVSPICWGVGRWVAEATYSGWYNDLNKRQFLMGGNLGVRGLPLNVQLGNNVFRANVEFRSKSLPVGVFRVGGVAFYDVGQAFESHQIFNPTQDVGIGARVLFAPFSRMVWRLDVAVPFAGPFAGWNNVQVTFGTGQAF